LHRRSLRLEALEDRYLLTSTTFHHYDYPTIYDPRTTTSGTFISAPGRADMVHDAERNLLYIGTAAGDLLRYSLTTGAFLDPLHLGGSLGGIDISPDGDTLAIADSTNDSSNDWIHVVDLATLTSRTISFPLAADEGSTYTVAFAADHTLLVSSLVNGSGSVPLRKVDLASDAVTTLASVQQNIMLTPSADHTVVAYAGWNASSGRHWGHYRVADGTFTESGTGPSVFEIGVSRDGSQFAVPTNGGTFVYDADMGQIAQFGGVERALGLVYSPVADVVYSSSSNAVIVAYDTHTFTKIGTIDPGSWYPYSSWGGTLTSAQGRLKTSSDGNLLFSTVPNGVKVYFPDISLSNNTVGESAAVGTVVGTLSTAFDAHNYGLVAGDGDADNAKFTVDAQGRLCAAEVLDDGPGLVYNIRASTTDLLGRTVERAFTIEVLNVAPTASLGNSGPVARGTPAVVRFTNQFDPSAADTAAGFHYSYALGESLLASSYADASGEATQTFTSPERGPRIVYGRIFDRDGGYTTYWTVITVVDPEVRIDRGASLLDSAFGTGGKVITPVGADWNYASGMALAADGKIVVAGYSSSTGNDDFAVARYNSDGSLDATFDGDGKLTTSIGATSDDRAYGVAVQADGKIVVVGVGGSHFAVVRYLSNGTLDPTFGTGGKVTTSVGSYSDAASSVALQADGKIVVAGWANSGQGNDFAVARYNVDGSLDTSFGGDGAVTAVIGSRDDMPYFLAIQKDGKIVLAGQSLDSSRYSQIALARFNPDGTLDTSFDGDGRITTSMGWSNDKADWVTVQADGRILVAGTSGYHAALLRYNADGTLDTSFDGDGKLAASFGGSQDYGVAVAQLADGKIVVAGSSSTSGGDYDFALARFNSDGTPDTGFADGGKLVTSMGAKSDYACAMAVQPDGKIVVSGYTYNGSTYDFSLVRYTDGMPFENSEFVGAGAFNDPGANVWTATVDYGDGSGIQPLALNADKTFALRHVFALAGTYTITVAVTDDFGGAGTDTQTVAVRNARSTAGLFDPASSAFFLRDSNSMGMADRTFGYGMPGSDWRPLAGDWDGNGSDTVGFYDASSSLFYLRNANSTGFADRAFGFGEPGRGWTPVAGDWNGDGVDTIGLYDPSSSVFYLRNANDTGMADATFGFGEPKGGWTPIVGDWDGDRIDTIGLYDPNASVFYLRNSNGMGMADLTFGFGEPRGGWRPVAGDWDGNGRDSVGLFVPSASVFYLRNALDAGFADLAFGYGPADANWLPLMGNWTAAAVATPANASAARSLDARAVDAVDLAAAVATNQDREADAISEVRISTLQEASSQEDLGPGEEAPETPLDGLRVFPRLS
jgi:uncharacterized delta-60 repeat protein